MKQEDMTSAVRAFFNVERGRAGYEVIRERIILGARVDGIHVLQLMSAMIIASIGLNVDSTEAVIGAMLICPLMGSVLAIAFAVASFDRRLLRRSIASMAGQCLICLVTSTLYFSFSPLATETSELLTNSNATIWDVLVALVGGFAGALGISRRQEPSTLIAGVAVATALMPPLCAVGFGAATADGLQAASALYEFLVNVVFIAFGATLVLVWLRVPLVRETRGRDTMTRHELAELEAHSHSLRRRLAMALAIFAIPCLYFSLQVVQQSIAQNGALFETVDTYDTEEVTRELRIVCPGFVEYRIGVEDSFNEASDTLNKRVVATVRTKEELDKTHVREVKALIHLHVTDLDVVEFEVGEP